MSPEPKSSHELEALRVALNFGNRVLVGRDDSGTPIGISVDLARGLGESMGRRVRFVEFERAVDVSDSAGSDLWDVCFLAVDPKRAASIAFTQPYVRICGSYLVNARAAASVADGLAVPMSGLRIGVVEGSAYTLHLSRQPGAERLVEKSDILAALAALDAGEVDALAGIEQAMEAEAALRPGSRVLQPPFMEIRQSMGVPVGSDETLARAREYLSAVATSGGLGDILERHDVSRDCAIVASDATKG